VGIRSRFTASLDTENRSVVVGSAVFGGCGAFALVGAIGLLLIVGLEPAPNLFGQEPSSSAPRISNEFNAAERRAWNLGRTFTSSTIGVFNRRADPEIVHRIRRLAEEQARGLGVELPLVVQGDNPLRVLDEATILATSRSDIEARLEARHGSRAASMFGLAVNVGLLGAFYLDDSDAITEPLIERWSLGVLSRSESVGLQHTTAPLVQAIRRRSSTENVGTVSEGVEDSIQARVGTLSF
jgi:hypothetical protein